MSTTSTFGVTKTAHPDCFQCLAQAEQAAVMARVTGSVGSTHDDGNHSATVVRVIATVDLDPGPSAPPGHGHWPTTTTSREISTTSPTLRASTPNTPSVDDRG